MELNILLSLEQEGVLPIPQVPHSSPSLSSLATRLRMASMELVLTLST